MPETEEDKKYLLEVTDSERYIKDLQERKKFFETHPIFKPGDIITWKEGMQNKTIPDKDVPGIVINNFFPALRDEERDVTSAYFNEQLDIQVGFISKNNEFVIFSHDSRRFKLYKY